MQILLKQRHHLCYNALFRVAGIRRDNISQFCRFLAINYFPVISDCNFPHKTPSGGKDSWRAPSDEIIQHLKKSNHIGKIISNPIKLQRRCNVFPKLRRNTSLALFFVFLMLLLWNILRNLEVVIGTLIYTKLETSAIGKKIKIVRWSRTCPDVSSVRSSAIIDIHLCR